MPRTNLKKHTLFLRDGDFAAIQASFKNKKASYVVREIVSDFVDNLNRPLPPEEAKEIEDLIDE